MKILKKIFSIENIYEHKKKYKVITIFNNNIKYEVKNTLKNCIAIIEPGGIGDYMFCRPYLKQLKLYTKQKIVFFASKKFVDFVKAYDYSFFDYIIPYDKDINTVIEKLKSLNIDTFNRVINLHTMTLGHAKENPARLNLIKKLKSREKIVNVINFENFPLYKDPSFFLYNKVIYSPVDKKVSELERRQLLFRDLFGIDFELESLNITPIFNLNKSFVLVSIMGNATNRKWNSNSWIKVINSLIRKTNPDLQILFLRAENEKNKINDVIKKVNDKNRCVNLAGNLPISLLPVLLTKAEFLLSVETGTVHIAHSVGCKTICLCCGAYYGRFQPYNEFVEYIYPDEFDKLLVENRARVEDEFYNINWTFKTNDIAPEKVIKVLDKYIEEFKVGKINE